MKQKTILITDDDSISALSLQDRLLKEGFKVVIAENGRMAMRIINENNLCFAFINIFLPDISGLQILKKILELKKGLFVVMIGSAESIDLAVTSIKSGAYDYITKPFDITEAIQLIRKALNYQTDTPPPKSVSDGSKMQAMKGVVGESPEMLNVFEMAWKVSLSKSTTVLIEGESGTGKDVLARAIHNANNEENSPFMDINCAAMPDSLVESELFGYEKGAFTDARSVKKGLFELAEGGSVLLDEIGDISLTTQAKLLKLIENKKFKRIGGVTDITINVRVIAATNKNIKEKVQKGEFREDLYYRLKVIPIYIPALRDRRPDIMPLVIFFINKFNKEFNKKIKGLSVDAEKVFMKYHWPGNVRELKNVIERAIILEGKEKILVEHLPRELIEKNVSGTADELINVNVTNVVPLPKEGISLEKVEKDFLVQALEIAKGNQTRAAKLLGLSRWALRYRMNKFGLVDQFPAKMT